VGKELKPKHLQEKVVTDFLVCVGFRVRGRKPDSEEREKKQGTFLCKGLAHVYFRVALCF
jgi:hypothetical protein